MQQPSHLASAPADAEPLAQPSSLCSPSIPLCSGIGLESALAFAAEGAHVVCADINPAAAERAVKLVGEVEGAKKALAVVVDVGKEEQIKDMVKKTVEEFGRLDVLL